MFTKSPKKIRHEKFPRIRKRAPVQCNRKTIKPYINQIVQ